jgi:cardiolipin synthase A/B
MKALRYTALGILGTVVSLFAFIGFQYSIRGTPVKRVGTYNSDEHAPAADEPEFLQAVQLLTGTMLHPGHRIEVMKNGDETYPPLWDDLRSARESITMQMYYCQPGRMADILKEILIDRARAGVAVHFLHDAFGSQPLEGSYLDSLRAAGVHVAVFRPAKWYELHELQHRSHIRVVVVDGSIGWTGGFGIADKWFGDGRSEGQWRETNARFTGAAVTQLQSIFSIGWAEATGNLLIGPPFFPRETSLETIGDGDAEGMLAGVMHAAPTIGSTSAERLLAVSIAGARHRLYITNAYFVPDQDFRDLLKRAAHRGVDVRILTPDENSDVKTTWWAGRYFYEELLKAGVRIFEYKPSMMHAKSLVVDDIWVSLGTMNFDNRSLAFNDESNLNVYDRDFGEKMTALFLEDLEYAEEMTVAKLRQSPWYDRVMAWKSARLQRLL